MKAVVIDRPWQISVKDLPYPKPGKGEVTIQVKNCGICTTEFHLYNGDIPDYYPVVPGHEFSGIVTELGPDISGLKIGTRVTADPNIYCGSCYFCKTNRGNHCQNWQGIGSVRDGAFAEYVTVPYKNVYEIPENISFVEATFIEPVSCIVYSLKRLKISSGDNVLVFGAGPIGLQIAQLIKYGNAASVTVTDLKLSNLEVARSLGLSKTVLADDKQSKILKDIAPFGFDIIVDATGIAKVSESAIKYVKNTGKIMIFGVCPPEDKIEISPFEIYKRDLEIYGSLALYYTFYPAIDLLNNKVLKVELLISDYINLDDVPDIFKLDKKDRMKIMIGI